MRHRAPRFDVRQDNAVLLQPFAVGVFRRQFFFQFRVVEDFSFLRVNHQHFARLQPPFLFDFRRCEGQCARLGRHHHHVVVRNQVAGRAQAVTVEHAAGVAAVGEQQGGRPVPGLHEDALVFVERFQAVGDGVFFAQAFRHQHGQRMRQGFSRHQQKFQHVVERRAVAHAGLDDGEDFLHVAQSGRLEDGLPRFHPEAVAANGVDFAVMPQQAERLCQIPRRKGVGAEPRVYQRQPAGEVGVCQVGVVVAQLHGGEHTFIYNALRREAGYVERLRAAERQGAHGLFYLLAGDVQLPLQLFRRLLLHDKHLLDAGLVRPGYFAEDVAVYRDVAHGQKLQAVFGQCVFYGGEAALPLVVVPREEHQPGAVLPLFGDGDDLQ